MCLRQLGMCLEVLRNHTDRSKSNIETNENKTKQKTKEKMFRVDENVLFFQASPAEETVA